MPASSKSRSLQAGLSLVWAPCWGLALLLAALAAMMYLAPRPMRGRGRTPLATH
jgi:hypothetical protein